ncbi:hypothetical protein [Amycolatopsis sp. NPDC004378]
MTDRFRALPATTPTRKAPAGPGGAAPEPGSLVRAEVVGTHGVDLEARILTEER